MLMCFGLPFVRASGFNCCCWCVFGCSLLVCWVCLGFAIVLLIVLVNAMYIDVACFGVLNCYLCCDCFVWYCCSV